MVGAGLALLMVFGCGKDNNNNPPGTANGQLHVRMTDSPADYDSVVINITEIAVHTSGSDTSEWRMFTPVTTTLDLLQFNNGLFVDLGTFTVPAGNYDQMRLKLGTGSYVVVDGVTHDLTVPSGTTSGIKIQGPFTVPGGNTLQIGLDFDAARSIHETGGGTWIMNPVIRLLAAPTTTGSIAGTVTPSDSTAVIYALSGPDTVSSTFSEASGDFALTLLPAGTYTVQIAAAANLRDSTITGVNVTAGQVTNLGTISLLP